MCAGRCLVLRNLCLLCVLFLHLPCRIKALTLDGFILLQMKEQVVDGAGVLSSWNGSSENPCSWYGVACNSAGNVSSIQLLDEGLSGSLPPVLGSLESIEYLDLSGNDFVGGIPGEIMNAKTLVLLNLGANDLTGSIPASIAQLSNLQFLYVQNNFLRGNISWLSSLNHLQELHLGGNMLSGEFPDLENLTHLESMFVNDNWLTGRAPDLNGSRNLKYLDLSANSLEGTVPAGLAHMPDLKFLNLASNLLTGEIPPGTWNNKTEAVDLACNKLNGSIPAALLEPGPLTSLAYLNLSGNSISGSIPVRGFSYQQTTLDLSNNKLEGDVTYKFQFGRELEQLWLHNNLLRGNLQVFNIPPSVKEVRLSGNRFAGTFPQTNAGWAGVEVLELSSNMLEGPIPGALAQNLKQSSGDVSPTWLHHLSRLRELRLANNHFSGDIPAGPGHWQSLEVLDISNNFLNLSSDDERHTLQVILETHVSLRELRLSSNYYIGSLPSTVGKLPLLEILDLSNGNLTGQISADAFTKTFMPSLKLVNLSNNHLWGQIPNGFSDMMNLTVLDISNNNLTGPLPRLPHHVTLRFNGNPGLCGSPTLPDCRHAASGFKSRGMKLWQLLAVLDASALVVAGCCLAFCWRWRIYFKRHQKDIDLVAELRDNCKDTATTLMSFRELKRATANFSDNCQIGVGGFGTVYKGLLDDGKKVAIKKSKREGSQLDRKQFLNEVRIMSQVHHRNLVKLLGCCFANEVALLVFEYVPKGTLEEHLRGHHRTNQSGPLTWRQRLKIALQTADALAYIHSAANPPIYHLDVKSANILLDENLNAKVADFGISKLAPALDATHITALTLQGTFGYMDPESCVNSKLTGKSDVYSFGVVLLELITSQPAVDRNRGEGARGSLINLVVPLIQSGGNIQQLVDPALHDTFQTAIGKQSILSVAMLAVQCVQFSSDDRPSMREVWQELQAVWHRPDFQSTPSALRSNELGSCSVIADKIEQYPMGLLGA